MNDPPIERRRGEFIVTTDRTRLDPNAALQLLRTTHWGSGMDRAVLTRALANSISFGLFQGDRLIGFGRAVTDMATYGHPQLQNLRRVALLTRDAQELYAGLGFTQGSQPLIYMEHRST